MAASMHSLLMPGSSRTLSLQPHPPPPHPLPATPRPGGHSSPARSEGACRGFACSISALSSGTRGSPWHTAICWSGSPRARVRHQTQALRCSRLKTFSCLPDQSTDIRQGPQLELVQAPALPLVPAVAREEHGTGQHQGTEQLVAQGLRHIQDLWMAPCACGDTAPSCCPS